MKKLVLIALLSCAASSFAREIYRCPLWHPNPDDHHRAPLSLQNSEFISTYPGSRVGTAGCFYVERREKWYIMIPLDEHHHQQLFTIPFDHDGEPLEPWEERDQDEFPNEYVCDAGEECDFFKA